MSNVPSVTALNDAQKARVLRRLGSGRRRLTAYHEAGHVLARIYCGHFFDRAVVCSVQEMLDGPHRTERGHEIEVEGVVEGYNVCCPVTTPDRLRAMQGGSDEHREAVLQDGFRSAEMDMMYCLAGPIAEARFRRCSLLAVLLTGGDTDWKHAQDRAETWFPNEPSAALVFAEKRARALVRSAPGWQAIERMADVLTDRGVLECEESEAIFADAYGTAPPPLVAWKNYWPPSLDMIRSGRLPPIPPRQVGASIE